MSNTVLLDRRQVVPVSLPMPPRLEWGVELPVDEDDTPTEQLPLPDKTLSFEFDGSVRGPVHRCIGVWCTRREFTDTTHAIRLLDGWLCSATCVLPAADEQRICRRTLCRKAYKPKHALQDHCSGRCQRRSHRRWERLLERVVDWYHEIIRRD